VPIWYWHLPHEAKNQARMLTRETLLPYVDNGIFVHILERGIAFILQTAQFRVNCG
jgi:hypothetical protein